GLWDYFGRVEIVRKNGADLALPPSAEDRTLGVRSLTAGISRALGAQGGMAFAVGGCATLDWIARPLEDAYGTRHPLGAVIYLQAMPAGTAHEHVPAENAHHAHAGG